jgi:hypothetical protein
METIKIQYCGGCNPDYDRTRLAAELKRELKGICRFVQRDVPEVDAVLVIHGCTTACAETEPGNARRCIHIRSLEEAAAFIQEMRSGYSRS